jgi:hypothetical protein
MTKFRINAIFRIVELSQKVGNGTYDQVEKKSSGLVIF